MTHLPVVKCYNKGKQFDFDIKDQSAVFNPCSVILRMCLNVPYCVSVTNVVTASLKHKRNRPHYHWSTFWRTMERLPGACPWNLRDVLHATDTAASFCWMSSQKRLQHCSCAFAFWFVLNLIFWTLLGIFRPMRIWAFQTQKNSFSSLFPKVMEFKQNHLKLMYNKYGRIEKRNLIK